MSHCPLSSDTVGPK